VVFISCDVMCAHGIFARLAFGVSDLSAPAGDGRKRITLRNTFYKRLRLKFIKESRVYVSVNAPDMGCADYENLIACESKITTLHEFKLVEHDDRSRNKTN